MVMGPADSYQTREGQELPWESKTVVSRGPEEASKNEKRAAEGVYLEQRDPFTAAKER
jgi:hypothetical protein